MVITFTRAILNAACVATMCLVGTAQSIAQSIKVKHVLLLSVDGLHDIDLKNFIDSNPKSAMAALAANGIRYRNAASGKPSDSFPGLLAMITGGSPKSTGVYYDDSYDRALSAPGSDCKTKGTEVVYDESIDLKPDAPDGGGGIDEAKLPRDGADGCKPVYPHSFLRVNTIFEVIKAEGMRTAWSDKHPSYEIANGPSGRGVDDLYVPEINYSPKTTANAANTAIYDDTKVVAIINQIDGKSSTGRIGVGVPALFGMNFQAVSVGQKTAGYIDGQATPSPELAQALKHTDDSIGVILAELAAKGHDKDTLVILAAKHGQSPIDPGAKKIIDKKIFSTTLDAVEKDLGAKITTDSVALIWLADQSKTADALAALAKIKDQAAITEIYDAAKIKSLFDDAATDTRVPDIVVVPANGVIYTKPTATKIAEHGGFGEDDTHVALMLSNPDFAASDVNEAVSNQQIAPTILAALGLDPMALQAVKAENVRVLPLVGLTQ